jgi:hypothetical protein
MGCLKALDAEEKGFALSGDSLSKKGGCHNFSTLLDLDWRKKPAGNLLGSTQQAPRDPCIMLIFSQQNGGPEEDNRQGKKVLVTNLAFSFNKLSLRPAGQTPAWHKQCRDPGDR